MDSWSSTLHSLALALIGSLSICCPASGSAQNAPGDSLAVPGQFDTLAQALAQAEPGDTVSLAPGVYHEEFTLKDGVTVAGQGPKQCILRSEGEGPQVRVLGEGASPA